MSKWVRWQVASGLLALLFLMAQPLWAHGGGILQIASQPAGPYKVSVWTSPTRLEAGELAHITVGVAGEDEEPVLDAAVLIEISSPETDELWSTEATTAQSTNKLFYEGDLRLGEDGRYDITIQIERKQGQGTVRFAIDVLPKSETNWLMVGFIGLGLVLSILMFRFWEKQPTTTPSRQR